MVPRLLLLVNRSLAIKVMIVRVALLADSSSDKTPASQLVLVVAVMSELLAHATKNLCQPIQMASRENCRRFANGAFYSELVRKPRRNTK